MIDISIKTPDFLKSFDHAISEFCDGKEKTRLELFILNLNANEFDYQTLTMRLRSPLIHFALSRRTIKNYTTDVGNLSFLAREKFKNYLRNTGELGEFLLYCFLETHLNAPKILSKVELKTSSEMPYHGSDGVHILKLPKGNYQLIFGEAKTYKSLTDALFEAFKSIKEFRDEQNSKGEKKNGRSFEKQLIETNLDKETFTPEDQELVKKIIYPVRDEGGFDVDEAFAIFIGFEISISQEDKLLQNAEFRQKIKENIMKQIKDKFQYINEKIQEHDLIGHNFYVYILPFSSLDSSRENITRNILE